VSIYQILHVNDEKMLLPAENINNFLKSDIGSLNRAIEYINKFHSYFHFEQSFAYLLCAYCARTLGLESEMKEYLDKSIFQDHTNIFAINFKNKDIAELLSYGRNIMYEDDFWDFVLGDHHKDEMIEDLDLAIEYCVRKIQNQEQIIPRVAHEKDFEYHKNTSHRIAFLYSLRHIMLEDFERAFIYAQNMVDNLEASHKRYHEYAAYIYTRRAKVFEELEQESLAKNDLIKANDLNPPPRG